MPTPDPQHQLPSRPNLDHLKFQARDLRKACQQGDAAALERLRAHVPRFAEASDVDAVDLTIGDAQLTIAREYGFPSWRSLKSHVDAVNAEVAPGSDANDGFSPQELTAYFAAVRDRDLETLRDCLEANPALTEARANDRVMSLRGDVFEEALRQPLTEHTATAIHHVSNSYFDRQAGHQRGDEVIRLLLEHGADPDAIGFDGNNGHCAPIVIATWEGGVETMRLLLEGGADVSGDQGVAALSTAASHDSTERFDLLLEYGAQASAWMLVKAGLSDRVIATVEADSSLLSATDDDGYSLLQAAAKRMKYDGFERLPEAGRQIAAALIERGAEVDVFSAAALNDVERLQLLLAADRARVDEPLADGNTPVNMAVQARSNDALRVLLESGAQADPEALRWAARMDYTDACRLLLKHGAQVDDEVTLAAAWRNKDSACLALVLAHGGNPNASDGRGTLHWVASNPTSLQLLLDAGADPNMRAAGATDNTPLFHTVTNAESTRRLLVAGADPTLTNANGDTPLDLALREEVQEVIALLRPRVEAALAITRANDAFSHEELIAWFTAFVERDLEAMRACLVANSALTEARVNDKVANLRGEALARALQEPLTVRSSTLIHLAANNYLDRSKPPRGAEAIQLLLEYGADPDATGYNENTGHCTAIVIAAWIGGADGARDDPVKLRLLLEAGADASGEQGIAALSTAASHDRINHFDLLIAFGAQASPWMLARAGLTDRVLALVDEDPSWLSRQNEEGHSLLQGALLRMEFDEGAQQTEGRRMAVALIERGATVDIFTAAALNDVDLLHPILEASPEQIDERMADGKMPVRLAVLAGASNTLSLLLEAGAGADEESLVRATRVDDVACSRLLIDHGAPVNDRVTLSAAWRNQDPACLQLVLDHGGNPSAVSGRGTLHWVAAENPQSLQLLIDAGADVNMRASGNRDSTPLHHAIGNIDSTTRLLAAGADPTLGDTNGDTPLDLALRAGFSDVAGLLKRHTDAVNAPKGSRLLQPTHEFFIAVGQLDVERVAQLLQEDPTLANADVRGDASHDGSWGQRSERPEHETARAIHFAVYGHNELLGLLIDHGADVDALGYEGNHGVAPPLVLACWEGDLETVRILLNAGANPNLPAVPGGSALHSAINHYDEEKIQLLLQHGARHDIHSAAAVGDLEEVKRLLAEDQQLLHRQDLRRRRTPLGWAIYHKRQEVIDYLLEIGVRALPHELVSLGRLDEIKQVVAEDPDFVNRRDEGYEDGADQPLLWALRAGHTEVAAYLLSAGADPNGHGRWETPLSLVCDDVEVTAMLLDAGADVNGNVFPGWPILAKAVHRRGFDVAELLLQEGADIDRPGGDAGRRRGGLTALQIVVRECRDHSSVEETIGKMRFLLERGANVNALSDAGRTALDLELDKLEEVQYDFEAPEIEAFLRTHGGKRSQELDS